MGVGVAVVGCGTISVEYLRNLTSFPDLDVLVCADLDPERARARAEEHGVPVWGPPETAYTHPDVEIVVNLTVPAAHAEVSHAAIAAGRHVWSEKPLTTDPESARTLLLRAAEAGVAVGCAPDTVLGAGAQSAARLVADGRIGVPATALTLMQTPGPESWHPDPEFLFRRGAGPLFDMGPYYLTLLAWLFGPVTRVAAVGRRSRTHRTIGSGPRAGSVFEVEVPTHVSALVEYRDGPAATMVISFDSPLLRAGFVEVTGSEATLEVPDPNRFDGTLRLRPPFSDDWSALPSTGTTATRGIGVLELARAVRAGASPRASGEVALHVLETMHAIHTSIDSGEFVTVESGFSAPTPLPEDWDPFARTL
ncbi:Gfo/Idh/MocA family protein [Marinactinospora thermotolerans]|uniref:Gfo/Idh/MocA family protein n=1 Tax=Marinactinospora thermotolerans TaxID=531310 RepID=UPI003D8F7D02